MTIELKVPMLPESVADAAVAKWYKKVGDVVSRDENLVDLETDKVMLEVPAPQDGVIEEIIKPEGSTVLANEVIAKIKPGAAPAKPTEAPAEKVEETAKQEVAPAAQNNDDLSPAVRRLVAEKNVDIAQVKGTGKGGRITKEDVERHLQGSAASSSIAPATSVDLSGRTEQRVPMSRLRARVAERLMDVKQSTAMLTTFNEVNMQHVMDLRSQYKDSFEKKHGVRLGFMSFFVKAAVAALKQFPSVNASIDGNDIVYHNFFDVGIAVSTERGLMVPILRNTEDMSMAGIEKGIRGYADKAKNNKITIDDMTGGTFTITNGGVFGSMLSTPILNSPQSAILGMHNIVKRPVVENDQVVIRPMMYLALSYDHRIIDGRESVSFLVAIKEYLEDPARLLLDV